MSKRILVTGATGYVGGRLIPQLLGDARDKKAVEESVTNIEVVYFLLHSIILGKELSKTEDLIANNFANSGKKMGVKRFIYLGGMVSNEDAKHSKHLSSRLNVGKVLRDSGVPTIELRAAVIIGFRYCWPRYSFLQGDDAKICQCSRPTKTRNYFSTFSNSKILKSLDKPCYARTKIHCEAFGF